MTGFGAGSAPLGETPGAGRAMVEVRSVNARTLDVRVRQHFALGDSTLWVEHAVRERLRRGRVEVTIGLEGGADGALSFDRALAISALRAFEGVAKELGSDEKAPLSLLAAVPNLFGASVHGDMRSNARVALSAALRALEADREREGTATAIALGGHCDKLKASIAIIRARAVDLPAAFRTRLQERLARVAPQGVDPARLETEVVLAADRCDVAEEIQRLTTHVEHLEQLVRSGDVEGRRLDFLLQEAMREATTLAVKAQDALVSSCVVDIKVELERMREQAQNVE